MKTLTFKGGIHPPENKELTEGKPIVNAKIPKRVIIPLSQHTGAPCKVIVTIGQEVKEGTDYWDTPTAHREAETAKAHEG